MNWNASVILAAVGAALCLIGLMKPLNPLIAVGAFLIGVAVVVLASGKN